MKAPETSSEPPPRPTSRPPRIPKGPPPRPAKPALSLHSPSINGSRYVVRNMPPLKMAPKKRPHTRPKQLTPFGKLNQMKVDTDGYYGELLCAVRFTLNHVIKQQGGWVNLSKSHQKSVQAIASVFFTHAHKVQQIILQLQTLVEAIDDGLWILVFQSYMLKTALREVLKQHPIAMVTTRLRLDNLETDLRRERISGQRQREEYVSNLRAFKDAIDQLRQERNYYKTLCEASQDASALARASAECDALREEKADLAEESKVLTEKVVLIEAERDRYLSECGSLDKTSRTQAKSLEALGKEKTALLDEIAGLSARLSKYESTRTSTPRRTSTKKRTSHSSSRRSSSNSPPPLPSDDDPPPPPLPEDADSPPPLPSMDHDDGPPPLPTEFFKAKDRSDRKSQFGTDAMEMRQMD